MVSERQSAELGKAEEKSHDYLIGTGRTLLEVEKTVSKEK